MHIVFKRDSNGTVEQMVKLLSGEMIHVDIIPNEPTLSAYTSYMFENFSKNTIEKEYSPSTHTTLYFPLTKEENERAITFLSSCVDRNIPYNYSDIFRCVLPGNSFLTDVSPESFSTLFCSQAVVLCLRAALEPEHPVSTITKQLNSRVTTPQTLYDTIAPFCNEVDSIYSQPQTEETDPHPPTSTTTTTAAAAPLPL